MVDASVMLRSYAINVVGPALIAKHVLPLFSQCGRSVFAALTARVGSAGDNRLGGWYSYRSSKAALHMVLRNVALEYGRRHADLVVAGLHPGTVVSGLSAPFRGSVPAERLFTPEYSASRLLTVLDGLTPADSGGIFAWDGKRIPY